MALHLLTGFPSCDFLHTNMDQLQKCNDIGAEALWKRMRKADKSGFSIGCGTGGSGEFEIANSGIIAGHAYTMIDVYDIITKKGQSEKLVKLRNPWGKFEYKGAFSDKDTENWTTSLKN